MSDIRYGFAAGVDRSAARKRGTVNEGLLVALPLSILLWVAIIALGDIVLG